MGRSQENRPTIPKGSRMKPRIWDRVFGSVNFKKQLGRHPSDYTRADLEVIRLIPWLHKHGATKILDAGCGNGRNTRYIAKRGFSVQGADFSRVAIKQARRADPMTKYGLSDIRRLPYRKATFDVVICLHTIFHGRLADIQKASAELFRVTKPGGSMFLTLPMRRGNTFRMGRRIEPWTFVASDCDDRGEIHHFFNRSEIPHVFQGWKISSVFPAQRHHYWRVFLRKQG